MLVMGFHDCVTRYAIAIATTQQVRFDPPEYRRPGFAESWSRLASGRPQHYLASFLCVRCALSVKLWVDFDAYPYRSDLSASPFLHSDDYLLKTLQNSIAPDIYLFPRRSSFSVREHWALLSLLSERKFSSERTLLSSVGALFAHTFAQRQGATPLRPCPSAPAPPPRPPPMMPKRYGHRSTGTARHVSCTNSVRHDS